MHAVHSPPAMNGVSHGYLMLKLQNWPCKLTTAGIPNVPQQKSVLPSDPPQWSGNDNLSTVELPKNDEPLDFLNGEVTWR